MHWRRKWQTTPVRTDADAETPILWPPHVKSWLIGKDPDAGRDWGQEEKGTTEDEVAEWHHRLNGQESGLFPCTVLGKKRGKKHKKKWRMVPWTESCTTSLQS